MEEAQIRVNNCDGITLDLSNLGLYFLPRLPKTLVVFKCSNNKLFELPDLPNIKELDCSVNKITSLPQLSNIKKLYCSHNELTFLPNMPNIQSLYCNDNKINILPPFFDNIEIFDCGRNDLLLLPVMPNIISLFCDYNKLTELPDFLLKIKKIKANNNNIVNIPELITLEHLECHNNKINKLPKLETLKYLNCCGNYIKHIKSYQNLEYLECCGNSIKELEDQPNLKKLLCFDNRIVELPRLNRIQEIDCRFNSLREYPDFPKIVKITCDKEIRNYEKEKKSELCFFKQNFKFQDIGIGGLDEILAPTFRRLFISRNYSTAMVNKLGIQHTKGLMLYGEPGCGKTLIARQIANILNAKIKIVNGPEIFNQWVGNSEENIRNLFKEAEEDYEKNKDNASIHIIIFDEIDSICGKRQSVDSGSKVAERVVNQLLTKIDGLSEINNIIVIGTTNRLDMIDPAILRAGRLGVHIEIKKPDKKGRTEILNIHLKTMIENNLLHKNIIIDELVELTDGFNGANLACFVRNTCSIAMEENINKDETKILITKQHFLKALDEMKETKEEDNTSYLFMYT